MFSGQFSDNITVACSRLSGSGGPRTTRSERRKSRSPALFLVALFSPCSVGTIAPRILSECLDQATWSEHLGKFARPQQSKSRRQMFRSQVSYSSFSFLSDSADKAKEKRPVANNAAGQILPVISDKLSHVTQVQGTRQDQIGNFKMPQFYFRLYFQ